MKNSGEEVKPPDEVCVWECQSCYTVHWLHEYRCRCGSTRVHGFKQFGSKGPRSEPPNNEENVMPDPTQRPECDPYSAGREPSDEGFAPAPAAEGE